MRCDEFETRLQHVLDQRKVPEQDELLRQHARVCFNCQRILALQSQLFDGLELAVIPDLPEDFARRVVREVIPHAGRRRRPVPWTLALAAVAATLLLAVVPAAWSRFHKGPHVASARRSAEPSPDGPRTDNVVAEDHRAKRGEMWWKVPADSILELYPPEARLRHRQGVDEIANDLRPITTSFSAAITALRRTIPVGKDRHRGRPQAWNDAPRSPDGMA